MLKTIFKPFIRFFKWHLNFFDVQKFRLETAKELNMTIIENDPTTERIIAITNTIWVWAGIFYSFSTYILFPVYLFLKHNYPLCPDVVFHLIEGNLLILGFYYILLVLQYNTVKNEIKEYMDCK